MRMLSTVAVAVALAVPAMPTPAAAQASPAPAPGTPAATSVPKERIAQAGAALREVTTIRENYGPQIASAKTDAERQSLTQRAMDLSTKAINDRGMTVDQYNDVMMKARADHALGDQVLEAARMPAK
jgi:hypothetical protein